MSYEEKRSFKERLGDYKERFDKYRNRSVSLTQFLSVSTAAFLVAGVALFGVLNYDSKAREKNRAEQRRLIEKNTRRINESIDGIEAGKERLLRVINDQTKKVDEMSVDPRDYGAGLTKKVE